MIRFLLDMGGSPICGNWLNDRGWDAKHLIIKCMSLIKVS